ncbi:MAG: DUF447 family protein [Methanobrevibacter ruminantium]|uniref:DUF447 domain-containing protein n=1 Tax=Methanobrevibacter ruminantium TaxID=83816 RepID=UPI0026EA7149|nr:DUF447 domain-containing protein [Methanobrevibacter ruminantium]MDO5843293.1 DUF447 family protein [Methanobrevibacter ruminantium]
METDLTKIGMYKDQQYEVIITTIDKDGNSNAAPFGLRVLEDNEVFLRIFEGGNTIKNIKDKVEFIVNITNDPLMFTLSTTNTIPEKYLTRISNKTKNNGELAYLTDADAYFICEVKSLKTGLREDDIKSSDVNFIKSEVVELNIKNKCVKPMNRAIHALIEALVNYSRINIVDENTQKYFLERFLESERVIKRVGNEKEKESIQILKEDLINQGFEI